MGLFSDVGNAVSSAASAVGDAAEGAVDAVADTAEDAVDTVADAVEDGVDAATDWACEHGGDVGCGVANVVGGAVGGLVRGAQDLVHDGLDIVRDLGDVAGSLLRLDFPGVVHALGSLVMDVADLGLDLLRLGTGGYVVGGVVRQFRRSGLRSFVEELVEETFDENPERLERVREAIGLDGGRFGLRLPAEHRVFVLDSEDVPLWRMHRDGEIDLYAMAGLLSFDSFAVGAAHPNTVVRSVGEDGTDDWWPVNRWIISRHLESEGRENRLRVYAMDRRTTAEMLEAASRKLEEIGVILEWNDGERFAWFRDYTRQPVGEDEYDFLTADLEELLARPGFDRPAGVNCELVALAAFRLERFGRVGGRSIADCEDFPDDCPTPGRTDRCCNTIVRDQSSGVIYRDVYPTDPFRYVLPHEIGHYLGLCHCGHDGFQNVMFSKVENDIPDWGLVSFYWESEPHFTFEDGRNAWRFIVDQMRACLTGETEPAPEEVITRVFASRPRTCAIPHEPAGAAGGAEKAGRAGRVDEGKRPAR